MAPVVEVVVTEEQVLQVHQVKDMLVVILIQVVGKTDQVVVVLLKQVEMEVLEIAQVV